MTNIFRHKRTIHGADDEELTDEYKDSDTEFEHDDDMDTDEDASFKEEEESSDVEEDEWNKIIVKAFKECQSKYEDRVKKLLDSENIDQRAARSLAFKQLQSIYRKARCYGISRSNTFFKLLKNQ